MSRVKTNQVYSVGGYNFTNELAAQKYVKLKTATNVLKWLMACKEFEIMLTMNKEELFYCDEQGNHLESSAMPNSVVYNYGFHAIVELKDERVIVTVQQSYRSDYYVIECDYNDDIDVLKKSFDNNLNSNVREYFNYRLRQYEQQTEALQDQLIDLKRKTVEYKNKLINYNNLCINGQLSE